MIPFQPVAAHHSSQTTAGKAETVRSTRFGNDHSATHGLPGSSAAMSRLRQQIERIGPYFRRVLLSGEAGSDFERVARALRAESPVAGGPFIVCALADIEEIASLWKHDPRVARIALRRLMSSAAGGMLWINGVDSLSTAAQALLLRLLEERSADGERLRIAAGTTANLKVLVAAGAFSHELRLALGAIEVQAPPLRHRMEDVVMLASERVHVSAREYAVKIDSIAEDFLDRLTQYAWPGNEIELDNALRLAVLSCDDGHLRTEHLPVREEPALSLPAKKPSDRLQDVVDQHLLSVLASCDGNKLRAADRLGISRSTLYRMLEACARPERVA